MLYFFPLKTYFEARCILSGLARLATFTPHSGDPLAFPYVSMFTFSFIQVVAGRHLIEPPPPAITARLPPKQPLSQVFQPPVPVPTKVPATCLQQKASLSEKPCSLLSNSSLGLTLDECQGSFRN